MTLGKSGNLEICKWQIKILAFLEKIALMRSHFFPAERIASLFPTDASIQLVSEELTIWVIVEKKL